LEVTASKKELTDARAKLRIASETSGTERAAGAMAQATREKDLAQRQQDQVVKEKNSLQEKLGKYKADFEQTQKDKFYAEERCKHLQKELDKVKEEVNGHRAASTIAKREADEAKRSQGCAQNDATALKSQLKTLQEAKGKADAQVKQLQDRNAQLEGELRASKEAAGKAKPDSGVDTHTLKRLTDENHRLKQELDEKTKDQAKLWSKIESQTRAIEKEKEAFQKDLASTRGPLSSTPMRSSSSLSYERSAPGGAKTSLAVSSPMSAKVAASTPSEPTTGRKFLVFDKDEVKATSTNLRSTASPLPLRSAELPESETGGTRRRFMP
jgi:chromosome segregation ATPase